VSSTSLARELKLEPRAEPAQRPRQPRLSPTQLPRSDHTFPAFRVHLHRDNLHLHVNCCDTREQATPVRCRVCTVDLQAPSLSRSNFFMRENIPATALPGQTIMLSTHKNAQQGLAIIAESRHICKTNTTIAPAQPCTMFDEDT
jgi:hypothetical protein